MMAAGPARDGMAVTAGTHGGKPVESFETTLRRLALADERLADDLLAEEGEGAADARLHPRVRALIQIGALIAVDATSRSYPSRVEAAELAGASPEDVVGALVAVAPIVGLPRVVAAAPALGLALGYDVESALE
jgi:alkylhydroperoxidase/carboxymuconolactone decarboxylase family protein YurZ